MSYVPKFYYIPRNDEKSESSEMDLVSSMKNLSLLKDTNDQTMNIENEEKAVSLRTFQDLSSEAQSRQLKYKQILGVLNKITPSKFHKLLDQIDRGPFDQVYVQMLAELIFTKALDDVMYVHLYSRLCQDLVGLLPSDGSTCFSNILINLCTSGFEASLNLDDGYIDSLADSQRFQLKRRVMTLFRLMGELSCWPCPRPLISSEFCWTMMKQLVDKSQDIHLECLYNFLFTLAIRTKDYIWPEFVWSVVASLAKGGCPPRIRFMFLELVEMKARGELIQVNVNNTSVASAGNPPPSSSPPPPHPQHQQESPFNQQVYSKGF